MGPTCETHSPRRSCRDGPLDILPSIARVTSTGGIPNRAHPISVPNGSPARSGYFECAHASRCQFSARAAPAAHTSPARPVLPSRRASSSLTSAPTMEGHKNPASKGGIPTSAVPTSHIHGARSPPAAKLAPYVTEIDRYAPIGPAQSASTPEEPDLKLLLRPTSWPCPKPEWCLGSAKAAR